MASIPAGVEHAPAQLWAGFYAAAAAPAPGRCAAVGVSVAIEQAGRLPT